MSELIGRWLVYESCPYPPCVFFFSSRRRHTRYWRDWSSDVCSSDLARVVANDLKQAFVSEFDLLSLQTVSLRLLRSEERRVGKECRSRWWTDIEKEKE